MDKRLPRLYERLPRPYESLVPGGGNLSPMTSWLLRFAKGKVPRISETERQALEAGTLARATLDVFAREPLPPDSPLWTMDSVTISAHMSGDVLGWRTALAEQFVDNAQRWIDGQERENIVDTAKGYVPRH